MSKAKVKRTEIVSFKIKNWSRYQVRKELKTMHYFRVQNDIFYDAKFASLTPVGKFIWFAVMFEATRQYMGGNVDRSDGQVELNVQSFARQHRMNARWVRGTISDLEQLQMVIDVVRHENVPILEKRREEETREEKSSKAPSKRAKAKVSTQSTEEKLLQTDLISVKTVSPQNTITTNSNSKSKPDTSQTWESFSNAYRKRYGSAPVRNATTNSQMSNFLKRIGEQESPAVAEFFITLNDQWYSKQLHAVGVLLRDCEKIRTLWVTGKRDTNVTHKTAHVTSQLERIQRGEF